MSTTPSERTEQRRRLLKRAAAAPAIFVLPTGAALAATSSQCVAANNLTPPDGGPWTRDRLPGGGWVFEPTMKQDEYGRPTYELAEASSPQGPRPAVRSCWASVHPEQPFDDDGVLR